MYYAWPARPEAYDVPQPVPVRQRAAGRADHRAARPGHAAAASVTAWLPPGAWTDMFTGAVYTAAATVELHRGLDSIPVLLRAGGILPLASG